MRQTLLAGLPALGLTLPEERIDALCRYESAMLEQNKVMNLTAIRDEQEAARLHLLDSLTLLTAADLAGRRVIDVGTGAGLPGVPLKLAEPSIELTLLDSTAKKIDWLRGLLPTLGAQADCVCARAEELAADRREQYDAATSRAVARLNLLAELCLPFVAVGGWFYALKGPDADAEVQEAAHAVEVLGGAPAEISRVTVPGADVSHCIVKIQKVKHTPPQYPRPWGKIKKAAL
jgi:16S rRNA (guanine527-N7)-methyltransferase